MPLPRQALILVAALGAAGCGRLLAPLVAPGETAAAVTAQAADSALAPAGGLAGVDQELGRLIEGRVHNRDELQRLKQALEERQRLLRERQGAAQEDPAREQPWHPRARPAPPLPPDGLRLASRASQRALPEPGPWPDGVAPGELPAPPDLTPLQPGWHLLPRPRPAAGR